MCRSKVVCILWVLLTMFPAILSAAEIAQKTRPNFVVLLADDLGYGDLGAYGSTLIKTPNLDRLAAHGVRLESFYASANICTASRGGLITGRYPIRLDLVMDVARPSNDIGISDSEVTLAEALKAEGYRTALIGKWHLGEEPERNPLRHGFDDYYGLLHSNDMAPVELYRGTEMIEFPVDQTTLTKRYTEEARKFIEQNRSTPFFLFVSYAFPHVPLFASEEFDGSSDAGLYGDVVEELDWSSGRILEKLSELGLDENTLVMFTSDNGPWWEGSPGQLRDRKGSAWEGGLRVPFIARWSGVIPPGVVSKEPAMNIDVWPTVMKASGAAIPGGRVIDGKDIMPMLKGEAPSPHEALFLFDKNRIAGVRSGKWKLVVESKYQTAIASFDHPTSYYGPSGLLFDVETDPSETYSFARENPSVVERMRKHLARGQEMLKARKLPAMWNR